MKLILQVELEGDFTEEQADAFAQAMGAGIGQAVPVIATGVGMSGHVNIGVHVFNSDTLH